ncbi:MAG TPA: SRPBCC family protein [Steroidobacteraceae bacterium]
MKKAVLGTLLALIATWPALGAPPKLLHVTQSVDIAAPVERVWDTVKSFDSLDKWHPGFSKDTLVKGTNDKPGAVRSLTIKDGPSFTEELLAFSDKSHSFRYRIVESPLPIKGYVSRLSVSPGPNGGSRVTWSGTFRRKNAAEHPPENESDAGVTKLVTGVYDGGLKNLQKMLGGTA